MAPRLSCIHLTMSHDLLDRHGTLTSISMALKDYCQNITELHIYPHQAGDSHAGRKKLVNDLCHLIAFVAPALIHSSFPTYLLTFDVIKQLMCCRKLRSLVQNTRGVRTCAESCRGMEMEIIDSHIRGEESDGGPSDAPFSELESLDLLVPSVKATRIITNLPLTNLDTLNLHFLGAQQGVVSTFDLGPFLQQLHCSTLQIRCLGLFALPPPSNLLGRLQPVECSSLQVLAKFQSIESFQLIHPYPVQVTSHQLGSLLAELPHLLTFILNPHPTVHTDWSTFDSM